MISFTPCIELKLLILFIYWNIKSLICHLSPVSFIIVAAPRPVGLYRFPSNYFLLNCQHLFLFIWLSIRFIRALAPLAAACLRLEVCSFMPSFTKWPYIPVCVWLRELSWLRSCLLNANLFHATILLYAHCFALSLPLDGSHANFDFLLGKLFRATM